MHGCSSLFSLQSKHYRDGAKSRVITGGHISFVIVFEAVLFKANKET